MDVVLARRSGEGIRDDSAPEILIFFLWTFAELRQDDAEAGCGHVWVVGDRAVPASKTAAEVVGAGKAHARASWYGGGRP